MYTYPNAQQVSTFAPFGLDAKVNNMKNFIWTFSNEIVNLKR